MRGYNEATEHISECSGTVPKGEQDGNVELIRGERSAGLVTGQAVADGPALSVASPDSPWPAQAAPPQMSIFGQFCDGPAARS